MVEVATPDSNPTRKSALNPCDIRIFMMLERGTFLSKNVNSIIKTARKCTIFVKAKSAKKRKSSCTLIKIVPSVFAFIF